ncbi:hypothetical protein ACIUV6_17965 [Pseudomonas aeruginosa]|uniref:hypothetical protein n=1 Tax=Pseudomonas aeruginosa TaxID=287 RepID=UPI000FC41522|nr:hypothetical protein [Pseudomonas aeruginosa]NPT08655.1 hypothetical protein [Pseudomonas aeruginosa]RUC18494.1 hypothetical protein IPC1407_19445 [Pseudomonas aeruginosa]TEC77821.1 hypothetical protein IPC1585_24920 [Pseudomonas aeruginosa]HBN8254634.1 hypothetical protein [Pseudomonas aeruginosa]HBN8477584.1 hypothetical protein [Pseudomonas aeruginosa]
MNNIELIKTLLPVVTFALGILATPVVEAIKEKIKWKAIYKNLILELEDELAELPARLLKMSETLAGLQGLKEKSVQLGKPFKYIPRKTEIYFLKASTEAAFRRLDKNQRYAIKSLFTQIVALDKYVESMNGMEVSMKTVDEFIKNVKRYLYTGSSMLNTMRTVARNSSALLDHNDNDIVNKVLAELSIELTTDDLIIKGKTIVLKD